MSLTGNLEDLPLLDILQIVSFSKKTGYLGISTADGEGAIVFHDGSVVACYTWDLAPLAATAGVLPAAQVRRRIEAALERLIRLREGQFQFSLTDTTPRIIKGRDITHETMDPGINPQELLLELARGMDEDRRDSSAALEASFSEDGAEVGESEPPAIAAAAAEAAPPPATAEAEPPAADAEPPGEPTTHRTVRFVAPRDVSPEYTVPLQAIPAELLRATEAVPATPEPPVVPGPTPAEAHRETAAGPSAAAEQAPLEPVRTLLLVDDEEDVRRALARCLTQGGYQVVEAEDPDSALKKAQRLGQAGIAFTLVTDLGMPASGGASFQGGFEVVKRLRKMRLSPPVVMMTDTLSSAVKTRAKQMRIAALEFKPGLSKLDPVQYRDDLQAFSRRMLEHVLPALEAPGAAAPAKPAPRSTPLQLPEESSRAIRLLQLHMEELRGLRDPAHLPPLVMRVARHFFERAVLFLVKDEQIRGLGGFGLAGQGESLGVVARQILVPLEEPSMFLDVISGGKTFAGEPAAGGWNDTVRARLGRFRAGPLTLIPLIAHRDTIAVLYGDNPETGRPLERLEALELFMHQAGVAMENALLQRKLRGPAEKG